MGSFQVMLAMKHPFRILIGNLEEMDQADGNFEEIIKKFIHGEI